MGETTRAWLNRTPGFGTNEPAELIDVMEEMYPRGYRSNIQGPEQFRDNNYATFSAEVPVTSAFASTLVLSSIPAALGAALLLPDGTIVASRDEEIGRGHAERLVPLIAEMLEAAATEETTDDAAVADRVLAAEAVRVERGGHRGLEREEGARLRAVVLADHHLALALELLLGVLPAALLLRPPDMPFFASPGAVLCPVCFATVPTDLAVQYDNGFESSNAVCVDTSGA